MYRISYQAATVILRFEKLAKPGMGESVLLKTGAKMYRSEEGLWSIGAYAFDQRDILPYARYWS